MLMSAARIRAQQSAREDVIRVFEKSDGDEVTLEIPKTPSWRRADISLSDPHFWPIRARLIHGHHQATFLHPRPQAPSYNIRVQDIDCDHPRRRRQGWSVLFHVIQLPGYLAIACVARTLQCPSPPPGSLTTGHSPLTWSLANPAPPIPKQNFNKSGEREPEDLEPKLRVRMLICTSREIGRVSVCNVYVSFKTWCSALPRQSRRGPKLFQDG